jgi:Ras-related protein Rab-5C
MAAPSSIDVNFRVIVAGSSGVGKSSLIQRIARDTFSNISNATVGVDYVSKHTITSKGVAIRTSYTDLAGQERFRAVCRNFYRDATAVLIVIDASLAAPKSAYEDVTYWMDQVTDCAPINVPIILVASKIDLVDVRTLSKDAIEAHGVTPNVLKRIYAGRIFYTSAITGEGAAELESEVRRIEEATSSYQLAATASARNLTLGVSRSEMTAESSRTSVDPDEPLICIVPSADGSLHVMRERGLVNLNPRCTVGDERRSAIPASASSLSPSSGSPLRTGRAGCPC